MSDSKKYYYMKLKENFFDTDEMIVLESMQDGYLYSNILLKLYLRSLKDNGRLMFKGVIPYTSDVLSRVVRHNVGVVEKAIEIFKKLGLVEILDNGAIYMLDIQNYIGKSTTEADRIRDYRKKVEEQKQFALLDDVTNNVQMYDKSTPELEIDLDLEKEINKSTTTTTGNPFRLFESEGFGTISSIVGDKLGAMIDEYGERWVCEAMKLSVYRGKRSLGYVDGILKSFKSSGIDEPWTLDKKDISVIQGGNKDGGISKNTGPNQAKGERVPEEWESLIS